MGYEYLSQILMSLVDPEAMYESSELKHTVLRKHTHTQALIFSYNTANKRRGRRMEGGGRREEKRREEKRREEEEGGGWRRS